MNTELKNAIASTDKDAQYDASAKRLLGQKHILAHILVKTVPEFMGMNPKDIVPLIEGEPCISLRTAGQLAAVVLANGIRVARQFRQCDPSL